MGGVEGVKTTLVLVITNNGDHLIKLVGGRARRGGRLTSRLTS